MLQQTRVETVQSYYERWMQRFPTLIDLARSPLQDVLSAWEGLGYYRRARNLHRAARIVVEDYGGELPADPQQLQRLPGIGRYTAGAISSIAFGRDETALDGNVRRVLTRLFDIRTPVGSREAEDRLWELMDEHLPEGRAGAYNQAWMDLGSMVCTPRSPQCERCPLASFCQARALGVQLERPVREPKKPIPHHTVTAAVIRQNGDVLIAQRPLDGLLGGLWEFPGGRKEPGEELKACLHREIKEELGVGVRVEAKFGIYQHAYTHFRVSLHAFLCTLAGGSPQPLVARELRWVPVSELKAYPMGKIDRQISERLMETHGE
jgi:A/G-specific adenine glycosylase